MPVHVHRKFKLSLELKKEEPRIQKLGKGGVVKKLDEKGNQLGEIQLRGNQNNQLGRKRNKKKTRSKGIQCIKSRKLRKNVGNINRFVLPTIR